MKKFTFMAAIAVVLTVFNGCQKDESVKKNGLPEFVSSKYVSEFSKYQKELLVFDAAKENSILIVCHSENEEALNRYLNNTDLELILDNAGQDLSTKSAEISKSDSTNNYEAPQDLKDYVVSVDMITYNLKPEVKNFFLAVKSKSNQRQLKSATITTPYLPNWYYAVAYTSLHEAKFFGVAHYGNGWGEDMYDYYTRYEKTNCGLCSWDVIGGGMIYESMPYYGVIDYRWVPDNQYTYTRLKITVVPDYYNPNPYDYNYLIAYIPEEFYSHDCTIGGYDSRNCYVGTPPVGTNAFINYNPVNGDVYFYYTPLPGNVCPVGLGFDGVNCAYLKVPSNCDAFISGNNWYVRPDLISF